MNQPVKIFISYAREDLSYVNELVKHLSGLKNQGLIVAYYDRQILPGEMWDANIKQNLDECEIILFLLSADFMASKYINDVEIKRSLSRHQKGKVNIIPVIIRSCDFQSLPLSKFQVLPNNAWPVQSAHWHDTDVAWENVVNGIKRVITGEDISAVDTLYPTEYYKGKIPKRGCSLHLVISICVIGFVVTLIYLSNGWLDRTIPRSSNPGLKELPKQKSALIKEVRIWEGLSGRRIESYPLNFTIPIETSSALLVSVEISKDGRVTQTVFNDSESQKPELRRQLAHFMDQVRFTEGEANSNGRLYLYFGK